MNEDIELIELEFHYDKILGPNDDGFGKKEPIKKINIPKSFIESVYSWNVLFPWPPFITFENNTDTSLNNRPYKLVDNYQLWMIERRLFFFESVEFVTAWFSDPKYLSSFPLLNQYITFSVTVSKNIIELDMRLEDTCKDFSTGLYQLVGILDYINYYYTTVSEGESIEDNRGNTVYETLIDLNDNNNEYQVKRLNEFTEMVYNIIDPLFESHQKSEYNKELAKQNEDNVEDYEDYEDEDEDEEWHEVEEDYEDWIELEFGDADYQEEIADSWEQDSDNPPPEHFS